MEVKQIYNIVNDITKEVTGKEALLNEDLTNIVDVGKEIFNANAVDNYVKKLVDKVGKIVFVNRPYSGSAPSVLMDSWEFGSVLQKIRMDLPEATENESWELEDGTSYDVNIFYKPKISNKFFNSKTSFEIPMSFTEKQVKESFNSAIELNGFISMIYSTIDKSMTVKLDSLIMRTINNFTAETIHNGVGTTYSNTSTRAINLLKEYNTAKGLTGANVLKAANALTNKDFIQFAVYKIGLTKDRLNKMSTVFNIGGTEKFTPNDLLHFVVLSDFANATTAYLEADTYHNELNKLPKYETIAFWQGSGTNYEFSSTSKIDVKTSEANTVTVDGILAVMFDRDALGVQNPDRRTTSNYNSKAEFYNNWFKADASYFNDFNENFVVFFIHD